MSAAAAGHRGRFVTLEGLEGVGKTTNREHVEERLRAAGHAVLATREPGGTPFGEQLRALVLEAGSGLRAETELLLMTASRVEHVARVIEPALARGEWVLCDRFLDASVAYQGGGRELGAGFVAELHARLGVTLAPDLTILLDLPVEVGLARMNARGTPDRIEREGVAFFERGRGRPTSNARRPSPSGSSSSMRVVRSTRSGRRSTRRSRRGSGSRWRPPHRRPDAVPAVARRHRAADARTRRRRTPASRAPDRWPAGRRQARVRSLAGRGAAVPGAHAGRGLRRMRLVPATARRCSSRLPDARARRGERDDPHRRGARAGRLAAADGAGERLPGGAPARGRHDEPERGQRAAEDARGAGRAGAARARRRPGRGLARDGPEPLPDARARRRPRGPRRRARLARRQGRRPHGRARPGRAGGRSRRSTRSTRRGRRRRRSC